MRWSKNMKRIWRSIVILVLALAAGIRAEDQTLLIELPPGTLPADRSCA